MSLANIDITAIKIDKTWAGHAKKIYFHDQYVGYIRNATGGRVEACSAFPNSYGRYPTGDARRGHDSSALIAVVDLLDKMINRADSVLDEGGNRINEEK